MNSLMMLQLMTLMFSPTVENGKENNTTDKKGYYCREYGKLFTPISENKKVYCSAMCYRNHINTVKERGKL